MLFIPGKMRLGLAITLVLLVAGCTSVPDQGLATKDAATEADMILQATQPVRIVDQGYAYEPSIVITPDGTLVVTARKANHTNDGTRTSSWLRYSLDAGQSWSDLQTPQNRHEQWSGLEGDLAVDATGRIYFADIYVGDATFATWTTSGGEAPEFESWKPALGSTGGDDRPWLAAHGDGIIYYLANNGAEPPAPLDLMHGSTEAAKTWFYRSEDAGARWTLGRGFAESVWCSLAASPADDTTVLVGCVERDASSPTGLVEAAHVSYDRGATWQRTLLRPIETKAGQWFPASDFGDDGAAFHAWIDDDLDDGVPGTIWLARLVGTEWTIMDATPMQAEFGMVGVSAAGGRVGLSYYQTEDTASPQRHWHVYGGLLRLDDQGILAATHMRLDDEPVTRSTYPPVDYFQNAVDADGTMHVAYQRFLGNAVYAAGSRVANYANDAYHVAVVAT